MPPVLQRTVLFRFACAFILLAGIASAVWAGDPPIGEWHRAMIRVRLPKKGCFTVTYPHTKWVEEPCATQSPALRLVPASGTGGNPSAEVTSGLIWTAIGSFDKVTLPSGKARDSISYSLQLNSEHFKTPVCDGAKEPAKCEGWQQFVYHPDNSGFIQYWLINYGSPCPKDWFPVKNDCTSFSKNGIRRGKEPISDLRHMALAGTAFSDGEDVLVLLTNGRILHAVNSDDILHLGKGWRLAQFGVFGNGGGATFKFDPETTLVVRTTVLNGTMHRPECTRTRLIGEKNNLEVVLPCCPHGGIAPSIVFTLSNNPDAASECKPRRE